MSLLEAIEVQGVRSFGIGSSNAAVIDFLTPLTIICGPNGTGKTTIIESLKFATTGELPTGRMAVFIHDLQLANRTRVDASVKLKFKDIRGRSCVITRRMTSRAEGTKGKVTTRSEESTIAYEKEAGEWKSLSSKVIDTKKEILHLLGVPAAILEYVVFCHQEESTWPLDEPKKLKERFDEIFQVTSYVKAIDSLKKIQKQNQQELHTLEATLPLLIKQQESKVKLHNQYIEMKQMIEQSERELSEKSEDAKELADRLKEARESVSSVEERERECKNLDKEISLLTEQVDALAVPDYQGTVIDLEREIDAYKSDLFDNSEEFIRLERNRKRWEDKLNGLSARLKELSNDREDLQEEIGELKALELMREKFVRDEAELRSELASGFGIPNDESLSKRLSEIVETYKKELGEAQDSNREQQASCQKEIDCLNKELAKSKGIIETMSKGCEVLQLAIKRLDQDLSEAKGFVKQSENLKKQIKATEQELQDLSKKGDAEKEIEELKKERDEMASKIAQLKKESRECETADNISKALNAKKREASELGTHLDSLLSKHKSALDDVFSKGKPEFPMKNQLSLMSKKIGKAVSQAESDFRKLETKKNKVQMEVEHNSEQIDQISERIYSNKNRIEKVVPSGDSVETRLAEVNALLTKSRGDLGLIDGCRYLYERWETEAKERNCCPLCERKYKNPDETSQLVEKVTQKRSELPTEIRKLQRRVKEHEELQKELVEVAPYVTIVKNLEHQKSELSLELQNSQEKLHDLENEFKKASSEIALLQEKQKMIFNVQVDASLMDNIWEKSESVRKEVAKLNEELEDEGEHRPLTVIRCELDDCETRHRDVVARTDALQTMMSERNKIAERLNTLREKHLSMGKKALQIETLEKTLAEKRNDLDHQMDEINELKKRRPTLDAELKSKMTERAGLQKNGKNEEERLSRRFSELQGQIEKLATAQKKVCESQDNSEEMASKQSRLSEILDEIEKNNEQIRVLNGKLDNVNAQQERGRRLDDQLRKMRLCERIVNLSKQKEETSWHGKPLNELKKAVQRLERQLSDLTRANERKRGEVEQQKVQVGDMKKKLESREFRNSEEEYKRSVIAKCVTEKVIEDLAVYMKVVDESVVKFHAEKMEEINEVLGQLWDQVYRGRDIETIQIKSESVDETEKKKSYNYRVVMTVDGSEIDMPGRCSAGQKMLASILIRIALSDVFCDRCSIIALDEPTTNLDVLKVENLGDMLAQIIDARCGMSKKNFQLIVITHDDRFVQHLRQLCRPEWVYALSKDASGLSKVKRHRTLHDAAMRED